MEVLRKSYIFALGIRNRISNVNFFFVKWIRGVVRLHPYFFIFTSGMD